MCFKKEQCWAKNFNTTYEGMQEIMHQMSENDGQLPQKTVKRMGEIL